MKFSAVSHCAGEILASYYRAHWQAGVLSTGVNCRSCPWCRANRAADYDGAGMCQVAGEPISRRPLLARTRAGSARRHQGKVLVAEHLVGQRAGT